MKNHASRQVGDLRLQRVRLSPNKSQPLSIRALRRLELAIDAQTREYARCRKLLRYVDAGVYSAGIAMTGSVPGLITWLCEPALALDYKVPLRALRTIKGRKAVINILHALAHGVYL